MRRIPKFLVVLVALGGCAGIKAPDAGRTPDRPTTGFVFNSDVSVSSPSRAGPVVGAGGAGRSAAEGLKKAGAQVTIFNRDPQRGHAAGERLKIPYAPLAELDPAMMVCARFKRL